MEYFLLFFINVTKTLGTKHELSQCLVRLGSQMRLKLKFFDITDFDAEYFNIDVQNTLAKARLPANIFECSKIIYKGTEYKKGYRLPLRQEYYRENVIFGKICFILCDETNAYILYNILEVHFIPNLCAYKILSTDSYKCINLFTIEKMV